MLRIRLARHGRKDLPHYHIVVIPQQNKREGKFVEKLGYYSPLVKDSGRYKLNLERYDYWIGLGAQPSKTVVSIEKAVKNA